MPFEVSLFSNETFIERRFRSIIPKIGETIIIDCGQMLRVIEVSHSWDDPDSVQVNCIEAKAAFEFNDELVHVNMFHSSKSLIIELITEDQEAIHLTEVALWDWFKSRGLSEATPGPK